MNVLFVCTGNSARSIVAEALLGQLSNGEVNAFSAGSMPVGQIHPGAGRMLKKMGLDPTRFRSKSWSEYADPAYPMDYIITVCDNAAGEVCPVWPGQPATAHWGVADPAGVTGGDQAVDEAFQVAHDKLKTRIESFLGLNLAAMSEEAIKSELDRIGQL